MYRTFRVRHGVPNDPNVYFQSEHTTVRTVSWNGGPEQCELRQLCLNGTHQFAHLWETVRNTRTNVEEVRVKESVLRSEAKLVSGVEVTMQSVSGATLKDLETKIPGRTLMTYAKVALKNAKKAYAYALGYLGEAPGYDYPSGMNEDDLDKHVLMKMFYEDHDKGEEFDEQWIFSGWMAFKCFGIKAPQDYRINLLAIEDGPKDGTGSRQQSRLEKKKGKDEERNLSNRKRGVPYGATEKDLVLIAQKEEDQKQRYKDSKMVALTSTITTKQRDMSFALELLKLEDKDCPAWEEQKAYIKVLSQEVKSLQVELLDLFSAPRETPQEIVQILGAKRSRTVTPRSSPGHTPRSTPQSSPREQTSESSSQIREHLNFNDDCDPIENRYSNRGENEDAEKDDEVVDATQDEH